MIDDIASVLDVKCRTLTLGVLILMMWEFVAIAELSDALFRTEAGDPNLANSLHELAPNLPLKGDPYPGCLRNAK